MKLRTSFCIMLAVRNQLRSGIYALYSYLDAWSVSSCTLRGAPRDAMAMVGGVVHEVTAVRSGTSLRCGPGMTWAAGNWTAVFHLSGVGNSQMFVSRDGAL